MLRMNSRLGVVATAFALIVTLGLAPDAHAQQTPRKPTTHKGSSKRSLVKKSAPVESKSEGPVTEDAPATKQPDAPVTKQPAPTFDGSAAAPKTPDGKAPGAADLAGGPVKLPEPPLPKKPLATPSKPKTSAERGAKPSPTSGTDLSAGPSTKGSPSEGPVNRVTDARLRPGAPTGAVKGKPKPVVPNPTSPADPGTSKGVADSGAGAGTTASNDQQETKPADGTTTTVADGGAKVPDAGSGQPAGEVSADAASKTDPATTTESGKQADAEAGADSDQLPKTETSSGSPSAGTSEGSSGGSSTPAGPTELDPALFGVDSKPPAPIARQARFRALTWSGTDSAAAPHMTSFVWCGLPGGWVMSEPGRVAAELKARPAGQRILFFWDMLHYLADHPQDRIQNADGSLTNIRSPFMDNGIAQTRGIVLDFLQRVKAEGGDIDVLVLDYERVFFWDPAYKALEQDPRWPRLAAELGYNDLQRQWDDRWVRWNEVMGRYFDEAIHQSTVAPLWSVFPAAQVVNYEAFTCLPDAPTMHVSGNAYLRQSVVDSNGNRIGLGTHDSFPFYGFIFPYTATARFDGVNEVGGDPFSVVRLEIHRLRAMRHRNVRPQMAWVSPKGYDVVQSDPQLAGVQQVLRLSPYWDELALQLGMNGSETFLYWNPEPYRSDQDATVFNRVEDQRTLNGLLAELNEKLGQDTGDSVYYVQPGFDDRILATGRDVGDRIVWRISFAPGVDAVRMFFTDNTSLVIRREANRPGAWFSHPKTKVMVFDSDRSAPAFEVVADSTTTSP